MYQLTILLLHVYAGGSRGKDNFLGKSMPVGCEFCAKVTFRKEECIKARKCFGYFVLVSNSPDHQKDQDGEEQFCSGVEHNTRVSVQPATSVVLFFTV